MILVDSLLYKIDQKLNKLSSNVHQEIPLEDKILSLNEAQIKLVKQKVDGFSTNSKLGLDAFKKRYEDLQILIEEYEKHKLTLTEVNKDLNKWSTSVDNLDPKYMFYIDSYVLADKGKCKDRIIWVNRDLVKHADIQILLTNTNYKPSFEYQETFNTISSDKIEVFTDGTFTPTYLYLSYLRYPEYINKEGYTDFEGKASVNQNSELPDYLEDELVDLTVQALAKYTANQEVVANMQHSIQTNE